MPNADQLIETHRDLLDAAVAATQARGYFSAFPESPSTRIWGDDAPGAGKAAFESLRDNDFPITTPGAAGTIAPEVPPYGVPLDVRYPYLTESGVDELLAAAARGARVWRDAGPLTRCVVAIEILQRIKARSFELAHAVMHTTGQSFVMSFQAGGAHALDRALEAIAYSYAAMGRVPTTVEWEKPRGKGDPQRLSKHFAIVPRGVALVIGCTTFPTWNSYPGMFASLVTGNPVVVKPHPHAVLPLAITVECAREVLVEHGFDAGLVTLAVEADGDGLASVLATRPEVGIVDFTGSSAYGEWLEHHATQAQVFTEKSGVNCVLIDSTDDLAGMVANLAFSFSLYSGQMCTTPQTVLVPRAGIETEAGHRSLDDVVTALRDALDLLLGDAARAVATLGALVDDRVLGRLQAAENLGVVAIASRSIEHPEFPNARTRTPLVLRVAADDVDAYGTECFGPVVFVVDTDDTAHSLDIWRRLTLERGALTASAYSTDAAVLETAEQIAFETGVSMSNNLTSDVYVNQSAAFSDFHGTGANPAANASLTDDAFVAGRFRVVETRRPA